MKLHAPIGAEILSAIDFPYPVVPIVRHHHENWDGTGYPDRIGGTDIPIGARILSVVDCFDALTSDRPYRRRMTDEDALAILHERRGTMYDPLVVDVFSANYRRIMPVESRTPRTRRRRPSAARASRPLPPAPAASRPPTPESGAAADAPDARSADDQQPGARGCRQRLDRRRRRAGVDDARSVVPATAMALFVEDERQDLMTVGYAAGAHAPMLRQLKKARGGGIAGWVAVNRRGVLNADAGARSRPRRRLARAAPAQRGDRPAHQRRPRRRRAVVLRRGAPGFTEDHLRLLELLSPSLAAAVASATQSAEAAPLPRAAAGSRRALTLVG